MAAGGGLGPVAPLRSAPLITPGHTTDYRAPRHTAVSRTYHDIRVVRIAAGHAGAAGHGYRMLTAHPGVHASLSRAHETWGDPPMRPSLSARLQRAGMLSTRERPLSQPVVARHRPSCMGPGRAPRACRGARRLPSATYVQKHCAASSSRATRARNGTGWPSCEHCCSSIAHVSVGITGPDEVGQPDKEGGIAQQALRSPAGRGGGECAVRRPCSEARSAPAALRRGLVRLVLLHS